MDHLTFTGFQRGAHPWMPSDEAVLVACGMILFSCVVQISAVDEDMLLYWRRSNSPSCEPFNSFQLDCNRCVCSADGTLYCTRMACMKKDTDVIWAPIEKGPTVIQEEFIINIG